MNSVSDLRFCLTCGGTRTVNGTSAASSAVPRRFEHHHAVFGGWRDRRTLGCFSAGQTSSSAFAGGASRSKAASAGSAGIA